MYGIIVADYGKKNCAYDTAIQFNQPSEVVMKKAGTFIAAVTIFSLIVFGIIIGVRSLGKHRKGKETDFSKVGKSVGQTIDAVIMKYNDIVDRVKNDDGKGEDEIDQALEMAKRELDRTAQSAKKALAAHS